MFILLIMLLIMIFITLYKVFLFDILLGFYEIILSKTDQN